jgi:beta-phosphoglucomutase-like phosphatase (HAD superfamily)
MCVFRDPYQGRDRSIARAQASREEERHQFRLGIAATLPALRGRPAPDTFVSAANQLGVPVERPVVFEDAVSGVEAGHAGGLGLVVGVDRGVGAQRLTESGAAVVVADLAELAS